MGREIKFRGYDKVKQTMVYNFPIIATAPYGINDAFKLLAEKSEGSVVIMQYTGLKDRFGADIYEGDKLFFSRDVNEVTNYDGMSTVIWEDGAFYAKGNNHCNLAGKYFGYSEIVGNIYQSDKL